MDCSTPGFPVHHQLPELVQIRVYQVGDAIPLDFVAPLELEVLILLVAGLGAGHVWGQRTAACSRFVLCRVPLAAL